jgi:hypothetical protein
VQSQSIRCQHGQANTCQLPSRLTPLSWCLQVKGFSSTMQLPKGVGGEEQLEAYRKRWCVLRHGPEQSDLSAPTDGFVFLCQDVRERREPGQSLGDHHHHRPQCRLRAQVSDEGGACDRVFAAAAHS